MVGLVAAVTLLAAGGVLAAVQKGGTLYIKAHNVHVQKDASPTSKTVGVLDVGDSVTWLGPDPADKKWHEVEAHKGGKTVKGVVFGTNLSEKKPDGELTSSTASGEKIDPQAFSSSGAATKAASESSLEYAKSVNASDAAVALLVMEQIAREKRQAPVAKGGAR